MIFSLVMAVCVEIGSYAFILFVHNAKPRLAPFLPYPDFAVFAHRPKAVDENEVHTNALNLYNFWYASGYDFGNWHMPYTTAIHNLITKSITYTSNSHGMRDRERNDKSSAVRIVFLGDSFVEGVGVADNERLTNILEKKTGCEVLNFGMGGNCGTVQQWLIYKHFADVFSHDAVFLGLFPANDFWDLETTYNYNALLPSKRPFLEGIYPDYSLVYMGAGLKPPMRPSHTNTVELKRVIFSCFASAHVLNYIKDKYQGQIPTVPDLHYSGYYDFTQAQWDRFRYSIEQIIAIASPRPLTVFIFPYYEDYVRFQQEGTKKPPLISNMEEFSMQCGFNFIDLAPYFTAQGDDMKRFYLFDEGDGHWNADGNKLAAEVVFKSTKKLINELQLNKGLTPVDQITH